MRGICIQAPRPRAGRPILDETRTTLFWGERAVSSSGPLSWTKTALDKNVFSPRKSPSGVPECELPLVRVVPGRVDSARCPARRRSGGCTRSQGLAVSRSRGLAVSRSREPEGARQGIGRVIPAMPEVSAIADLQMGGHCSSPSVAARLSIASPSQKSAPSKQGFSLAEISFHDTFGPRVKPLRAAAGGPPWTAYQRRAWHQCHERRMPGVAHEAW
jgi:hypothetical protein